MFYIGCNVSVHLKIQEDLFIFKKAGCSSRFDLSEDCDSDKRPEEIGSRDQPNTCPALLELHSTQTRCRSRTFTVPAQQREDCSLPLLLVSIQEIFLF